MNLGASGPMGVFGVWGSMMEYPGRLCQEPYLCGSSYIPFVWV